MSLIYEVKNYGYKPDDILLQEHYVLGGYTKLKGQILNFSGDWFSYLPKVEVQHTKDFDTFGCVSFGVLNQIEMIYKLLTGKERNYSDRYTYITSKTIPNGGNSPHIVLESIRKSAGLLLEELLPFDNSIRTIEQFNSPRPMTKELLEKGQDWWLENSLGHEWVFTGNEPLKERQERLLSALKYSPVGISVYAWVYDSDKRWYVKPYGVFDNHYTIVIKRRDDGAWIVFDSYEENTKVLDPNYNFGTAKVIYINPSIIVPLFQRILDVFAKILNIQSLLIKKTIERQPEPIVDILKPSIEPEPSKIIYPPKIVKFAKAIEQEEGNKPPRPTDRNQRNNNPGNLKYSSVTASFGAIGKDKDNFCIYPNYETGFDALCEFLILACNDGLKPYHEARTLYKFIKVYANPPNDNYALNVSKFMNVSVNYNIKNFLL